MLHTWGDLTDVGFSYVTPGVVPGPVEIFWTMHNYTALILYITGLSWSPVSEENWPAICPHVGAVVLHHKKIQISLRTFSTDFLLCFGYLTWVLTFSATLYSYKEYIYDSLQKLCVVCRLFTLFHKKINKIFSSLLPHQSYHDPTDFCCDPLEASRPPCWEPLD